MISQPEEDPIQKINRLIQNMPNAAMVFKNVLCLQPNNSYINTLLLYGKLDKQSNMGLLYNNRFLFVMAPGIIKYRNEQPNIKLDQNNHKSVSWKKEHKMEDVDRCALNGKMISIYFKNVKDPWTFRAKDTNKAQSWANAFKKAINATLKPQIIVKENPIIQQQSIKPIIKRKTKQEDNPIIIQPKSSQQIYEQMYKQAYSQLYGQIMEKQRRHEQCKKNPMFQLLTSPQQIFFMKFQKEALKYFKKLVDQSEVEGDYSLKFDVQFYSSLQKQDFDNLSYMYEKTYNTGIIRVIPSILVSYKGVRALIRYKLPNQKFTNKNSQIVKQLQSIEVRTRIQAPDFKNSDNKVVLEYYQVDTTMMKQFIQFQIQDENDNKLFVINSLMGYIPVGQLPITSQLLKKKQFVGHVLNPDDLQIQFVKQIIQKSLKQFIDKLDKMHYIVCNTLEFNKLILKYGLSRFHLPEIYERCSLEFIKKICLSQMIILISSEILAENLQNTQSHKQFELIADFLNLIVGKGTQSNHFWSSLISEKVENRFGIVYKQKQVNIQYILSGIIQYNGIQMKYQKLKNQREQSEQYIKEQFIEGFKIMHRGYSLSSSQKYKQIQNIISEKSSQSFVQLVNILKLRHLHLPQWIVQSPLYQDTILLLATFIPPTYSNSQQFHHLNLYKFNYYSPVSAFQFQLLKINLNWFAQEQKQSQFEVLFQLFLQKLTFWIGDYSPLHGELYLQIAKISLKQQNYSDVSAFVQCAILNFIHVDGLFSLKLVDCYALLGKIQKDKTQAIYHFQRAKRLLDNKPEQQTLCYLNVVLQLSKLYFQNGQHQQSIQNYFKIISLAQKLEQTTKLIQCFIMLGKNYSKINDIQRYNQLVSHALMLIQRIQNKDQFIQLLRVCIMNSVLKQSVICKTYLKQIQELFERQNSINGFNQSLEYLMNERAEIQTFLQSFRNQQYLLSALQSYQQKNTQKTMLYHVIQVIGSKIIYETI